MLSQPFFIPAAIFAVISIPLVLGMVPRNWAYGFRTRRALSSDETWYPANRFGGWGVLLASAIYVGVAWLLPYAPAAPDAFRVWLIHLAAFGGPLVAALVLFRRYVRAL